MRHNTWASDTFAGVEKVTNNTGMKDIELCLILSVCYPLSFAQRLGVRPWNLWFYSFLILTDIRGYCKPSEFFKALCLLYCDHQQLCIEHSKRFDCFSSIIAQFVLVQLKFPNHITLPIHLCSFQIMYLMNPFITSYHYTNNRSGYLPRIQSCDMRVSTDQICNVNTENKYWK